MKGWKFSKVLYVLLACLVLVAVTTILQSDNQMPSTAKQEGSVRNGMDPVEYTSDFAPSYLSTKHVEEFGKLSPGLNVEVLLEKYSPAMSIAPGFPFRIDAADGRVQSIDVSVDSGALKHWNPKTGIVVSKGQSDTVSSGETIYWSPLDGQNPEEFSEVTITMEAIFNGTRIGRQQIHLTRDASDCYYANVGEFDSNSTAKMHTSNMPQVINKYVNAINARDWDSFVDSYSPERQKDYIGFPSQYQTKNRTGILSVDSIRVYEAKEISSEHITKIEPHFTEINNSLYDNIRYFYVGFDDRVCEESEFFYNGVSYDLLAIGNLDGTEYILGHENVYDFSNLDEFGYAFHSEAEKKAQNVVSQREKGIIVNFNNDIISTENSIKAV